MLSKKHIGNSLLAIPEQPANRNSLKQPAHRKQPFNLKFYTGSSLTGAWKRKFLNKAMALKLMHLCLTLKIKMLQMGASTCHKEAVAYSTAFHTHVWEMKDE